MGCSKSSSKREVYSNTILPLETRNTFFANGIVEEVFLLSICFHEGRQQKQEVQSCSLWNKNHTHRKIDKMKRQRAMYQMNEQDKTPEKQLNEVEIGNPQKKNSE